MTDATDAARLILEWSTSDQPGWDREALLRDAVPVARALLASAERERGLIAALTDMLEGKS